MAVSDDDLAHLLRRTEFVVRPSRLAYLKTLPTLGAVLSKEWPYDGRILRVQAPIREFRDPTIFVEIST